MKQNHVRVMYATTVVSSVVVKRLAYSKHLSIYSVRARFEVELIFMLYFFGVFWDVLNRGRHIPIMPLRKYKTTHR